MTILAYFRMTFASLKINSEDGPSSGGSLGKFDVVVIFRAGLKVTALRAAVTPRPGGDGGVAVMSE